MSITSENRWKARALRAEQRLRTLAEKGIKVGEIPTDLFSEEEYLLIVLEHKDGSIATIDDLKKAKAIVEKEKTIHSKPLIFKS